MKRNDVVRGWFGTGVVTDVAEGWLETNQGEPYSEQDNLVRIMQRDRRGRPRFRFVYYEDIKEIV